MPFDMEPIVKVCAAAVTASAVCLLLKKNSPEMGLPLALGVCCGIFILALGLLRPVLELVDTARKLSGLPDALFYPVVKSVGIGICTKLAADTCRDSGQAAMGSAVETAGAVCALYAALPLMETLLDMLEEML